MLDAWTCLDGGRRAHVASSVVAGTADGPGTLGVWARSLAASGRRLAGVLAGVWTSGRLARLASVVARLRSGQRLADVVPRAIGTSGV
eukprot:7023525-Prymnesium_polylepis.1